MFYDVVIKNSEVVTASGSKRCDIAITNGQITSLGEKLKGEETVDAEVRIYDRLFTCENPSLYNEEEIHKYINPNSLKIINAKVEPSLINAKPGDHYQFERVGFFCADDDHQIDKPVFNQTINLRGKK